MVSSEVKELKKLVVHSPDSGLGIVVPSKAQDWLFEDIIQLDVIRQEYDQYLLVLLYFLDPTKVKGKIKDILADPNRAFFRPNHADYFNSSYVLEFQKLLADVLANEQLKKEVVSAVVAIEQCTQAAKLSLLALEASVLANVLITGALKTKTMLFPPLPNLIFTRDIGIVINDHLLLNKPARHARSRESLLAKLVFLNHPIFETFKDKIIEVENEDNFFLHAQPLASGALATIEGGDVMMVAPNHLLIGISERTSLQAATSAMHQLFDRNVVEKLTMIRIPDKRDYMHIDTIFTQIAADTWVLLGSLGKSQENLKTVWQDLGKSENQEVLTIRQFTKNHIKPFECLEDLLTDISKTDLHVPGPVHFVYSGDGQFPSSVREQWTDSCNLLTLKDGVAIGYDRNQKTVEAFAKIGYNSIKALDLLEKLESGALNTANLEKTIILLPSAELSRARGGSHCMSMPISRV